jgi:hypothetical protein
MIHFSPDFATDGTVYALLAASYFGFEDHSVLYRSTDSGQTWEQASDADPQMSALAMGLAGELWVGDAKSNVNPLDPAQLTWGAVITPTPTPAVPTPMPTPTVVPPAGFYYPEGNFATLWTTDFQVRQALGWAVQQYPNHTAAAFQPFEAGVMWWRKETLTIYVLFSDGTWEGYQDLWTPDQPEHDPSIQPPSDRLQPIRGFGKLWREQPGVRDQLGWALQNEKGFLAPLQIFERGFAFGAGNSVYIMTREPGNPGRWLQR